MTLHDLIINSRVPEEVIKSCYSISNSTFQRIKAQVDFHVDEES